MQETLFSDEAIATPVNLLRRLRQDASASEDARARHLELARCDSKIAVRLVMAWHSRLPRCQWGPWQYAFVAHIDGYIYAAALWNNPSARMLPGHWLELRRMACAPDAPKNAASRFLSMMTTYFAEVAPDRERCISYQDTAVHSGTIYKAAGWTPTHLSTPRILDRSKDRVGTSRKYRQSINGLEPDASAKQRWEKPLHCRLTGT